MTPDDVTPAPSSASSSVALGRAGDFPVPSLRMVHAGGHRLLVAATADGLHVTDHACPHQGYGLAQGDLADGVVTCAWHNWKYRLADGRCLRGEEDLRMYPVTIRPDGTVVAEILPPDPAAERSRLTVSLRRGLEGNFAGQIARDVVRLLRADADPVQVAWEAVAWGAPRAEFGFGHAMASLVDCLGLAQRAAGDARALPLVTAFAQVAHSERRRPLRHQPEPLADLPADPAAAFRRALEAECLDAAEALLRGALAAGADAATMRRWLIGAVSDHHLSYGHGAIYVQKAFALVDQLGWDRADTVLPHLVPALGYGTREDRLPYMRPFVAQAGALDLGRLATLASAARPVEAADPGRVGLRAAMTGRDARAVVPAVVKLLERGASLDALLDDVVEVASERMWRYDPTVETAGSEVDFGWLDLTHALTYASAARWAAAAHPGPDALRLVLWTTFLAQYAGRKGYRAAAPGEVEAGDPIDTTRLCTAALEDRSGSTLMTVHLVKTTNAAVAEATSTGSATPLLAAARFVASPRRESFVALNVRKAQQLADGRIPD